jgi:hypothetical protein
MIEMLLYSVLAIAVLVLAAWLARVKPPAGEDENLLHNDNSDGAFSPQWLELAHRVFDPADYLWLRDELCFPQVAALLARHRKDLAIKWLKALRSSFKEFVGVPNPDSAVDGLASKLSSWQSLWLTLRFQFLLFYALFVVRLFGPYHRLVPRFGWLEALRGLNPQKARSVVGAGRIP